MERKYKLTDECMQYEGHKLYRIQSLRSFSNVKEGELGGYIESEDNLSHDGMCWVYDEAKVFGNAEVFSNADVCDNAKVFGNANVFGNAKLYNNAYVYSYANVFGNAEVRGDAKVFDCAEVLDAEVFGNAKVYGDAKVCGNAKVYGKAEVSGDAKVYKNGDYIVFKNWWSSGRYFTWTRSNNKWRVGCFWGTGAGLINNAYEDSELSGREYERVVKYVESILADENAQKK